MGRVIRIVFTVILVLAYIAAYLLSTSSMAMWLPNETATYYAKADDGQYTAIVIAPDEKIMYVIDFDIPEDYDDRMTCCHIYGLRGESPIQLGDFYFKEKSIIPLRKAPHGYNVDRIEIKCLAVYRRLCENTGLRIDESTRDTIYINDDSLKTGGRTFKRIYGDGCNGEEMLASTYVGMIVLDMLECEHDDRAVFEISDSAK